MTSKEQHHTFTTTARLHRADLGISFNTPGMEMIYVYEYSMQGAIRAKELATALGEWADDVLRELEIKRVTALKPTERLAELLRNWTGSADKKEFLKLARQFLIQTAEELGLRTEKFEIRVNEGGPAVSGDVILHHDLFYVSISANGQQAILARCCSGRTDYSGGTNIWYSFNHIAKEGVSGFAEWLRTTVLYQQGDE